MNVDNIIEDEERERSHQGILAADWLKRRQESCRENDQSRTDRTGKERSQSPRKQKRRKYVVYLIVNKEGQPFYVGQTKQPEQRLASHRSRFGKLVEMQILETDLDAEDAALAERKWIDYYANLTKGKLKNIALTDKARGSQRFVDPTTTQDERLTVSIRNVSTKRWCALQQKSKEDGRTVWAILDRLFDAYLTGEITMQGYKAIFKPEDTVL